MNHYNNVMRELNAKSQKETGWMTAAIYAIPVGAFFIIALANAISPIFN